MLNYFVIYVDFQRFNFFIAAIFKLFLFKFFIA